VVLGLLIAIDALVVAVPVVAFVRLPLESLGRRKKNGTWFRFSGSHAARMVRLSTYAFD
jgi:hypothetical protein